MGNSEEMIYLLSEIRHAQERTARKVWGCCALTIVLIVLLLPVVWSAWHQVLVWYF